MAYDFLKRYSRGVDGIVVKSLDPKVVAATASAPGTISLIVPSPLLLSYNRFSPLEPLLL